jgi:molybdate transport system substrate-binding protein
MQLRSNGAAPTSTVRAAWVLLALACSSQATAGTAIVAVATNFSEAMEALQHQFESASGHGLRVVAGSSGKLYAQVTQGAPFDVLLSADQERPRQLVSRGLAESGSQFTYAVGRLVLWSANPDLLVRDGPSVLRAGGFRRLAMANPELAPYGRAALETLRALGVYGQLRDKLVFGENIGRTHAMAATGNADLGFVALSYLLSPRNQRQGSRWLVPDRYHAPVRQDAVLLDADNEAAGDFFRYLRGAAARQIIRRHGYRLESLPSGLSGTPGG